MIFPLPLHFKSYSVIIRVVIILGTATFISVTSCPFRCPVDENLRIYAEKTDVALGHLVFEGCA